MNTNLSHDTEEFDWITQADLEAQDNWRKVEPIQRTTGSVAVATTVPSWPVAWYVTNHRHRLLMFHEGEAFDAFPGIEGDLEVAAMQENTVDVHPWGTETLAWQKIALFLPPTLKTDMFRVADSDSTGVLLHSDTARKLHAALGRAIELLDRDTDDILS